MSFREDASFQQLSLQMQQINDRRNKMFRRVPAR
jgi:hypothetical protein